MIRDLQRLDFKISKVNQKYDDHMNNVMSHTHETFEHIQTPGWSSMVKSQISQKRKNNTKLKQSEILEKLFKLEASQKLQKSDHQQPNDLSLGKSHRSSNKSMKQLDSQKNKVETRWKQITVHDYLYLNSKKIENKRMIEKVMDEEYKRKSIYTFTPSINRKSIQLAQSKYLRISDQTKEHQSTIHKHPSHQPKNHSQNHNKNKQVLKYQMLNRLFYFLSAENQQLSKESIHQNIEELPLICIKTIQPILQKVYAGKRLTWVEFIEEFNSKQITNKESLINILSKWWAKRDRISEDQTINQV